MASKKFPGVDALRASRDRPEGEKRKPGRPRKLTPEQLAKLPPSHQRKRKGWGRVSVMTRLGIEHRAHTPQILTREIIDAIVENALSGAPMRHCAIAVGVAESTLHEWMRIGSEAGAKGLCADLVESLARSHAQWVIARSAAASAGGKGWQGSAWMLERRAGADFAGPPRRLEHSGPSGGAIRVQPMSVLLPELEQDAVSRARAGMNGASAANGASSNGVHENGAGVAALGAVDDDLEG